MELVEVMEIVTCFMLDTPTPVDTATVVGALLEGVPHAVIAMSISGFTPLVKLKGI